MASLSWTETSSLPFDGRKYWIEKYRAALFETNPQTQLERIAEAYRAIQESAYDGPFDEQAAEDAKEVLRVLREESLSRASFAPWL